MFHHIKKILSSHKLLGSKFWLLFICAIMDNGVELTLPYIIKHMYEIINNKGLSSELWKRFGLGILVLIIVEIGSRSFRILYQYLWQDMSNKLSISYRSIVKDVEISRIHDIGTGKLLSKFEQGISAQTNIFFEIITSIVAINVRGLGVIVAFALYAPQLLWVLVLVVIVFVTLEYYLGKHNSSYTNNIRSTGEEITKLNVRYFSEFLMVKIHNNFNQENQSYQKISKKLPYRGMMQEFYSSMKYSILYLGLKGAEILTVAYLGSQLLQGQNITIATIIMLSGYLMRARRPIQQATRLASTIQKQLSKYIELQQFVTQPPTITNGTLPYHYHHGDISFNQVRFGYHADNILFDNFDLTIAGGSKVALVGHSGSGKSTLIKLILRLYDIQSGQITIDNQELTQLDITSVYDHVGYLTQEPAIFDGTVRENLIYGISSEQHTTDQQLIEACTLAMFDTVLDNMKDGLDTMVGERGIKLSGGEKQRLAIARLFLKNPKILILDEPTAALDSISEHAITKALETISTGRTTIVIAHRLQTVMNADRIIVMDHGQIIQSGTHDQLLSQEGMYRSLVNLQSGIIEE